MANREITYYSLLSKVELRYIESIADELDEESFFKFGYERKWLSHLWIGANNDAFLEYINHQNDLGKLDRILGEQLKLYARKQGEGFELDKSNFYGVYKARKDWLNHTIFICKNEYNKTQKEIFNEVVKWCIEWQNEWLETYNPYSPDEREEMSKELKTPLWEQLNENELSEQSENIDWVELFDMLDIEKPIRPNTHIKNSMEQKRNYFSKASFTETIRLLTEFKEQTYLLSQKRKLEYLNSLSIEKPRFSISGNTDLDQVAFEARNNYYEFLTLYRINLEKTFPSRENTKYKPELNERLISFSKPEIIDSLHKELKGFFIGNEVELKRVLEGEIINTALLFPSNQNKFVEVFKRLKYNGYLLSRPKEIKDWICQTFVFQFKKSDQNEVRKFNASTVHDILTKDKGEPTRKERICVVDWLPYKSHHSRRNEAEKESK